MTSPTLETPRLRLRPPVFEDFEPWAAFMADEGASRFIGGPGPEIGWALVRGAWGQGFAQEAATATMSWSFSTLGWPEVIHLIDPTNEPSRRLAGRLGSALRGTVRLPAPYSATDLEVWAQDRATWQARAGR